MNWITELRNKRRKRYGKYAEEFEAIWRVLGEHGKDIRDLQDGCKVYLPVAKKDRTHEHDKQCGVYLIPKERVDAMKALQMIVDHLGITYCPEKVDS